MNTIFKTDKGFVAVCDDKIQKGDFFLSYLLIDDWGHDVEENREYKIFTCLSNEHKDDKYMGHYISVETGRNGYSDRHFILETETCKKIISTDNSFLLENIPQKNLI